MSTCFNATAKIRIIGLVKQNLAEAPETNKYLFTEERSALINDSPQKKKVHEQMLFHRRKKRTNNCSLAKQQRTYSIEGISKRGIRKGTI